MWTARWRRWWRCCATSRHDVKLQPLRRLSAKGKEKAAAALKNLAADADNKVAIAKVEGALAALVALLRDGSAAGKESAAGALKNLAFNDDNKKLLLKLGYTAGALA